MEIQHDADVLEFAAYPFDIQRDGLRVSAPFSAQAAGAGSQTVQFVGPVKQSWLDALTARGIRSVQYVAKQRLHRMDRPCCARRLDMLHREASWLQFSAPLHDFLKVDRSGGRVAAAVSNGSTSAVLPLNVFVRSTRMPE